MSTQFALVLTAGHYSYLRATIGSTLAALRAGSSAASAATTIISMDAIEMVAGSVGLTPNNNPEMSRDATSANGTPMAMPASTSNKLSRSTIPSMLARVAPSASRMPISLVLRAAVYDITPYNPRQASRTAKRPKNPEITATKPSSPIAAFT